VETELECKVVALMLGFLFSLISTMISMRIAVRVGALDYPNAIKIHASPTPTIGDWEYLVAVYSLACY